MKKATYKRSDGEPGTCWFCDVKTPMIYDDMIDEFYCCLDCIFKHRLRRKIRNFRAAASLGIGRRRRVKKVINFLVEEAETPIATSNDVPAETIENKDNMEVLQNG